MRLNKFIAHTGYCTRREAEALVKQGKVTVDGKIVTNPGDDVNEESGVHVDGVDLKTYEPSEYYLINKEKDNHSTKTEDNFGLIGLLKGTTAQQLQVLHPMSFAHTGLHVITNDQQLIERANRPEARIKCYYHVALVDGSDQDQLIEALNEAGLTSQPIEDEGYYHVEASAGPADEATIMNLAKKAKQQILRIDRTTYAGMTKKDLKRGWNRKLTTQEIIMLKHFV